MVQDQEGVLVQNDKKQNTTIASGYYLITGLPNGAYDFGNSKAGFNKAYTGYLDVTILSVRKFPSDKNERQNRSY